MVDTSIIFPKLKLMQMKRLFIFLMFSAYGTIQAQSNLIDINIKHQAVAIGASEILFKQGIEYLQGIKHNINLDRAKSLFLQAANMNNSHAMNALGNLYLKQHGTKRNGDSAMFWYDQSINHGNGKSCYNLGNMYKAGSFFPQNFANAVKYYKEGVALNNSECKQALAYMYYKGLGIIQDYEKAFSLFKETAENGNTNSMYFLGLCYRNGYGVDANQFIAKQWLQLAASKNVKQAFLELDEESPENMSTLSSYLQDQISNLKTNNERFHAASSNNYDGVYSGYAIYYDWSGKYISDIQPLTLSLKKDNQYYSGTWKEGNFEIASIKLIVNENHFRFDKKSKYTRTNHYSGREPEIWGFNEANMELAFTNDSIQLSGFVQFYSSFRREPGKPFQIILKKGIEKILFSAERVQFSLFPNPSTNYTNVHFRLLNSSKVAFQLYTPTGELIYSEHEKILPAGIYNFKLPTNNLTTGTYQVQLLINGKINGSNSLVKL